MQDREILPPPHLVHPFHRQGGVAGLGVVAEHRAAFADYGKDTEWEDFDGFERLMDAFTELGNAVVSAAFALDATQSAAPAAA